MRRRNFFFWTLVLVFVFLLPTMIFYTTGYRLVFDADTETTVVTTTGGMYITTPNLDVDVYLDEEQIKQPRLFRNAYYIQNIKAGQHRIVVQAPEVHTWVKELPVDSHIVIEAAAFNMPTTPRLRPITEYVTSDGAAIYQGVGTSSAIFGVATTTEPYVFATSSSVASFALW